MKMNLLLFVVLILACTKLNAQEEKIIKLESKHYCQCYKSFNKEIRKIEKKDSKPKDSKLGMKIFGGDSLTLSLGDCLNKKRNKKTIKYIESLNDKEKDRFRKKVNHRVKKKCPKNHSTYNS